LDGIALRVPTATGSVVDLTVELGRNVTVEEINNAIKHASNDTLGYTEDPIVSSDVIGVTYGSLFDGQLTQLIEVDGKQLVKVISWYDNEMSYTAQLIRTAEYLVNKNK
jgi:glyceraldehyde 3-phosphate dehydrogenase